MDSIQTNKKEYNIRGGDGDVGVVGGGEDECICFTTPYTICTLM